jgi:hypothetical protein
MEARRYACLLLCAALAHPELPEPDPVVFEEVSGRAGLDFVLRNGATGSKHLVETMLGGVAAFDYDGDGRADIFFCNGARLPDLRKSDPTFSNRLYRNNGDGTFSDVTARAGVAGRGYSMGVAAGDFDNDGHADLFVAGVRNQTLYRNRGDGTFEDVTARSGLDSRLWSVAAGWFDYDRDGSLDLFVVRYLDWDPSAEPACREGDVRTYCHPRLFRGLANALYRNNGDGTFTDVSASSGIAAHVGKGMGLAFADFDGDGDLDVFVTNDTTPNFLFRNDGSRFREVALEAGVAYNDDGRAVSAMGVDFRDYDNDGREDLFVTALANESFALYRSLGGLLFRDVTYPARVGRAVAASSGWSNGIFDFNNDGYKDLFSANGDVQDNTELYTSRPSRQRSSLLLNRGDGTFLDWSERAGPGLQVVGLHRGAAFADFDGDGRIDVVVTRINERAELFRNASRSPRHWLQLRLVGTRSNRSAIGARVRVVGASGHVQWNHVTTAVGYSSSTDAQLHFGLGADRSASMVEIRWPDGAGQRITDVPADQVLVVRQP